MLTSGPEFAYCAGTMYKMSIFFTILNRSLLNSDDNTCYAALPEFDIEP
jgi:hypothetical protein